VIGRHTHPRPEAGYLKESLCCWSTVNRPSRWRPVRVSDPYRRHSPCQAWSGQRQGPAYIMCATASSWRLRQS